MRIIVDCTETYKTKLNTGIQRVVTQIANHSPMPGIEIVPVIFDGIGFARISPTSLKSSPNSLIHKAQKYLKKTPLYDLAKSVFNTFYARKMRIESGKDYVLLGPEDILLLADLVRSQVMIDHLKSLSAQGFNKIVQIIYDLLPLTYPQFFRKEDVLQYEKLSSQWMDYNPHFVAISKKVQDEVQNHFNTNKVNFFHLGSDFKSVKGTPHNSLRFDKNSYFLVVGTIEPRKNHAYILNAFNLLWQRGSNMKLVFIGRSGWNISEIRKQIVKTQQYHSEKFFWLEDADDSTLEKYYKGAIATITASYDEGFGLPIIESLARSTDVLCSDINVFHEIGVNFCSYFDLKSPESLAELIQRNSFKKDLSTFRWITWQESIDSLIRKIYVVK